MRDLTCDARDQDRSRLSWPQTCAVRAAREFPVATRPCSRVDPGQVAHPSGGPPSPGCRGWTVTERHPVVVTHERSADDGAPGELRRRR
jgi:hypothetical protein